MTIGLEEAWVVFWILVLGWCVAAMYNSGRKDIDSALSDAELRYELRKAEETLRADTPTPEPPYLER